MSSLRVAEPRRRPMGPRVSAMPAESLTNWYRSVSGLSLPPPVERGHWVERSIPARPGVVEREWVATSSQRARPAPQPRLDAPKEELEPVELRAESRPTRTVAITRSTWEELQRLVEES